MPKRRAPLHAAIVRIARAAAASPHRGRGEAAALQDFARLAQTRIPDCGVLAPAENHLLADIDKVACKRLGHRRRVRAFQRTLRQVDSFSARDAIDSAHADLVWSTAKAYYYAGLAWGLTFGHVNDPD